MAKRKARAKPDSKTDQAAGGRLAFAALALGLVLTILNIFIGGFKVIDSAAAYLASPDAFEIQYLTVDGSANFYKSVVSKDAGLEMDTLFKWPVVKTAAFKWFDRGTGEASDAFGDACKKVAAEWESGQARALEPFEVFSVTMAYVRNIGTRRASNIKVTLRSTNRNDNPIILYDAFDKAENWKQEDILQVPDLAPGEAVLLPLAYACLIDKGSESVSDVREMVIGPSHRPFEINYEADPWGWSKSQAFRGLSPDPTLIRAGVEGRG